LTPLLKTTSKIKLQLNSLLLVMALSLAGCSENDKSTSASSKVNNPETKDRNLDILDNGPAEISDSEIRSTPENVTNKKPEQSSQEFIENIGFSNAQDDAAQITAIDSSSNPPCLTADSVEKSPIPNVEQACNAISQRLASVEYSACQAAKLEPSGCFSVDGFPILIREFPPRENREPLGRILIVGGTHGDELTTVSVTMRWIEKLRTNGNGVDLNRNMPSDDWTRNALKYWRDKGAKDPRKYPGENASSEPETRWLIQEITDFQPDAIISVHAPYGIVDFDSLALNTAPKSLGKLHLNLLGTYPGSLGNYAGINLNIPVITLELPHSWVMPSEAETSKIWEDIVSWLKANVNKEINRDQPS